MTAEHSKNNEVLSAETIQEIAQTFVRARLTAGGLNDYPGPVPTDLATAYLIQDHAIELWPESIGGWKVGRIPPAVEDQFGCDRLAGPIFADTILHWRGDEMPQIPGFAAGGAAVEAEFVAVIGDDAPEGKLEWTDPITGEPVQRRYYDGMRVHKAKAGWAFEAGDPTGTGWGDAGYTIRSEWNRASYDRGTVGIAHSGKDTGGSQWFVCHSPQPHLDGRYTVFARVVAGLEIVDRIQRGDRYRLEVVTDR